MSQSVNNKSNSNKTNGTWKTILIGIITILLSIGGSLYTSGKSSGIQEEKTLQLECKVAKLETQKEQDHDLLLKIDGRLINIESMVKQLYNHANK